MTLGTPRAFFLFDKKILENQENEQLVRTGLARFIDVLDVWEWDVVTSLTVSMVTVNFISGNTNCSSMKTAISASNTSLCQAKSMSDQEPQSEDARWISQQAHLLARDIVCYRTGRGRVSTTITARNLRRLSDELEDCHQVLLGNMCNALNMTADSAHEKFVQVADEVFRDGVNWGRIVALFTFGGKLAQFCLRNGMQDNVEEIEQWVGDYVAGLSSWIQRQGGWDSFDKHFQDPSTRNKSGWWTGILLATVGIGSLATFVYKQC